MTDSDKALQAVLEWVGQWVDTGEDRINDEDHDPPLWEFYAGWLVVDDLPATVRAVLDPDGDRWQQEASSSG